VPPKSITTRTIVGLEVHVQLLTKTKMFCGCPVKFGAAPNTNVCPVCLGHPGTLPVINRMALHHAVRGGLALGCTIAPFTKWDRKSYYYPDLPKNYQISQYDLPVASDGRLEVSVGRSTRSIGIIRAHLEEDAGKNIHDPSGCTLVDLNRTGTPLLEIVTRPDITSAAEAFAFCTELQRLMTYLGISEGVMQKGQMRFEPNVNVAIGSDGREYFTPIAEIKNLNSFRAVRLAIEYESKRQVEAWLGDHDYQKGKRPNENRGFSDEKGITEFQRSKEAAHDYRYFPDPDLVPVELSETWIKELADALPELPLARRRRFVDDLGLPPAHAETIVAHLPTADLFERVCQTGAPADVAVKQFVNIWMKLAADRGAKVTDLGVDPDRMADLSRITEEGVVNRSVVGQIAEAMLDSGDSPEQLAESLGLVQIHDAGATAGWVSEVIAANDEAVRDALDNPKKAKAALGFLRGQVMQRSGGKADPKLVGKLIEEQLAKLDRN